MADEKNRKGDKGPKSGKTNGQWEQFSAQDFSQS